MISLIFLRLFTDKKLHLPTNQVPLKGKEHSRWTCPYKANRRRHSTTDVVTASQTCNAKFA